MTPRDPTPVSEPTLLGVTPATQQKTVAAFFDGQPWEGAPARLEMLPARSFFDLLDGAPRPS